MKKATRLMLKYLEKANPHAKCVTVTNQYLQDAKPNQCISNAVIFVRKNPSWMVCSGWIVGDFWGDKGTAILPHYWVMNDIGNSFFDVTPINDTQNFDYILDIELQTQLPNRENALPVPLKIWRDGSLTAYLGPNRYAYLDEIDYQTLFAFAADS